MVEQILTRSFVEQILTRFFVRPIADQSRRYRVSTIRGLLSTYSEGIQHAHFAQAT